MAHTHAPDTNPALRANPTTARPDPRLPDAQVLAKFHESAPYAEYVAHISRRIARLLAEEHDVTALSQQVGELAAEIVRASADPDSDPDPLLPELEMPGIPPSLVNGGYDLSPGSGARNPLAPPIVIERDHENLSAQATVTLPQQYMGPPERVHGGIVALMLDHVLGSAAVSGGRTPGFTAQLDISYRNGTPLGEELTVIGWIDREDGRKRYMRGEVRCAGQVTAEAKGLWLIPRELYRPDEEPQKGPGEAPQKA